MGVAGLPPPRGVAEPRPLRGVGGTPFAVGGRCGGGWKPRPGGVDCALVGLPASSALGGEAPSGAAAEACLRCGGSAVASANVRARGVFKGLP